MIRLVILLALALLPIAAPAQEKPGAAGAGPGQGYVHPGSQIGAPAELAGFTRRGVSDQTGTGRDVIVQYRTPDEQTFMTVYFYRSPYPSAALWFEQARRAVEANPTFRGSPPADRPSRSFATSGGDEDAMLVTYRLDDGRYRSTALAVSMAGNWIVKLRMTSSTLDEATIADRIVAAARALQWPRSGPTRAAAAIPACGERMPAPGSARETRSNRGLVAEATRRLSAAILAGQPRDLCFERQAQLLGIYREGGEAAGYLVALGDNGRVARVRPLDPGQAGASYVVEFYDLDAAYVAGFFRGLPTPEQALAVSDRALRSGGAPRVPYVESEVRPDSAGTVPVT